MSTWGFLGGHIAHEARQSSQPFSPPARRQDDNDDVSSGELSGRSAASMERRRRRRRRREARQEGEQPINSQVWDFLETLQSYIPRRSSSNLSATEKSHEMGAQYVVTIIKRIPEEFREAFIFTTLNAGKQLLGDPRVNREWKEALSSGKVSLHRPATHEHSTQTTSPPPTSNVVYLPPATQQQQHQQQQQLLIRTPQPHPAFTMGPMTYTTAAAPSPQPTSQLPPSFPTPSPASMVPMSPYPDVPPTPGRSLETPQPVAVPIPVPVQEERKDEEDNNENV